MEQTKHKALKHKYECTDDEPPVFKKRYIDTSIDDGTGPPVTSKLQEIAPAAEDFLESKAHINDLPPANLTQNLWQSATARPTVLCRQSQSVLEHTGTWSTPVACGWPETVGEGDRWDLGQANSTQQQCHKGGYHRHKAGDLYRCQQHDQAVSTVTGAESLQVSLLTAGIYTIPVNWNWTLNVAVVSL